MVTSGRSLSRRLAHLERSVPAADDAEERESQQRWQRLGPRLKRLIRTAAGLLSNAESQRVLEALEQWHEDQRGPYADWFRDLSWGHCRLPALAPEVMKALLLAWLSPECDQFRRVCRQCGLEYPDHQRPPMSAWKRLPGKVPFQSPPPWYDLPDFFDACPHCGASLRDFDWAHLVRDLACPWKALPE